MLTITEARKFVRDEHKSIAIGSSHIEILEDGHKAYITLVVVGIDGYYVVANSKRALYMMKIDGYEDDNSSGYSRGYK